jgi:threonine dehydratase
LSGKLLGVATTIIMPHDAPVAKKAATEGYGATVVSYDRYKEDREDVARALQQKTGMVIIPPYDHLHVIAGQGTAAKELFEDVGELDYLLVCLGGGGLLAGSALSAHALSPNCKVYGVEPEAGNDGQQSLRKGEVVRIAPPRSIADGALTLYLGQLTFGAVNPHLDRLGGQAQQVSGLLLRQAFQRRQHQGLLQRSGVLHARRSGDCARGRAAAAAAGRGHAAHLPG